VNAPAAYFEVNVPIAIPASPPFSVASPASSPNATSCASWRSAELARSTSQ
jgi:hypothetical protein